MRILLLVLLTCYGVTFAQADPTAGPDMISNSTSVPSSLNVPSTAPSRPSSEYRIVNRSARPSTRCPA